MKLKIVSIPIYTITSRQIKKPQTSIQQLSLPSHRSILRDARGSPIIMCYGSQRLPPSGDDITPPTVRGRRPPADVNTAVVESLRLRLAETEARLQEARAREAELSKKLFEMKRFVSVMEILETFLKQRFLDQQHQLSLLISQSTVPK